LSLLTTGNVYLTHERKNFGCVMKHDANGPLHFCKK
jgi:hypothetical protein